MKRGVILVLGLILVIFFIGQISASFTKGNLSYSIGKFYELGDAITGWGNISLNNEPTNSLLKDSFGESISLIDLLKKPSNFNFDYNCNPVSCASGYLANNEAISKTLNLDENESVLIGFNISSNSRNLLTDITSFSFNLESNNPETEKLPLSIDILNDGQVEWQAYVASGNFASSENFGCFKVATGQANLVQTPSQYCERIKFTKSAGVEIGAYVKGADEASFDMKIQRVDNEEAGACTASVSGGNEIKRVGCIPSDFSIKNDGDYFVCITPSTPDDAGKGYTISYEQDNPCGFSGSYNYRYDYDFEIFAKQEKYASAINFILNNGELVNSGSYLTNIEGYLESYISEAYNNNCSKGCVIPVKIYSGINQQINIKDASIIYAAGVSTTINKIYDSQETPAKINSGFQKLYLGEAGFFAPMDYGNITFSISLNDVNLLSTQITVGAVPVIIKSLTPTKTGVKYPTRFQIILNMSMNITEYNWNFGDGGMQITSTNSVTHTYNQAGIYNLTVILVDFKGKNSSKEFSIEVKPASEIVPTILIEEQAKIVNIKSQFANFSQFEQKGINNSLNLGELEKKINKFKDSVANGSSEAQFEAMLGELLNMKIPNTIAKTAYTEGIIFYPEGNNIDLDTLSQISGGNYDTGKSDQYKEAIFAWNEANTNMILIYSEISSIYPDYQEPLLRTFYVTVTNNGGEDVYIVIKNMKDLSFKEDYSQKKQGGYYYIDLKEYQKDIIFSTTENVDFINLPMFVSPAITSLSLAEWSLFTPEGELKKWVLFTIIAIIIIFIVLIIWIILQIWYKRKYENHLFKNRNNLYNLINYIGNEKKKEINERDIIAKLRKAGWSSEQIKYALKKYAGKRTGMLEIPIGKIFRGNKNANNSAKR
jgi:hypothetical protein